MSRGFIVAAVGLAAVVSAGCENPVQLEAVENPPPPREECIARGAGGDLVFRDCIALSPVDTVNVLFVVDHGPHALGLQARLADAMPAFVDALALVEQVPHVRVGFTTTQDGNPACEGGPGTGGRLWRASCREHPQDFVTPEGDRFDEVCAARCDLDDLDTSGALLSGDGPWLDIAVRDDGTIDADAAAAALRCNALLGRSECPFTAPVASTSLAWNRSWEDTEDQFGFLAGNPTVVVIVSGGSECSVTSEGVAAFDPEGDRALWSDPDAEQATAATCFRAGNLCDPPDADGVMSCLPADIGIDGAPTEDAPVLRPVANAQADLESLGDFINMIFPNMPVSVFVVGGFDDEDPTAAPVTRAPEGPALDLELGVQPQCEVDGDPVVPATRLHAVAVPAEPAPDDVLELAPFSACADDWTPVLEDVADAVARKLRPMCVPACAADDDDDVPGLQPDCRFTAESPTEEGTIDAYELPRCEMVDTIPADEHACWFPKADAQLHPDCADVGYNLELGLRWRGPVPGGTAIKLHCTLSQSKTEDCPDLR